MRKTVTHAIECDMDEDCTRGAGQLERAQAIAAALFEDMPPALIEREARLALEEHRTLPCAKSAIGNYWPPTQRGCPGTLRPITTPTITGYGWIVICEVCHHRHALVHRTALGALETAEKSLRALGRL